MCTALPSIGFIGLGIMGLPMAEHLCNAGYSVTVYNRTAGKTEKAKQFGAYVGPNPRHLAERCDIVITMLTNPTAVKAVLEGPDGLLANPKKALVWIQMSTLDVASTQTFAKLASERGLTYVDCPVAGSKKQVEAAELILLASGKNEALDYIDPVLKRFGKVVVRAGDVGAGTSLKLCMNLIVAQMTTALAESIALAEASKLDPSLILQVIKASPALNCGYFTIKGPAFVNRDFSPAFSLDNMAKDVGFMLEEARAVAQKLPVTEAVSTLLKQAQQNGHGTDDLSSVIASLRPVQRK